MSDALYFRVSSDRQTTENQFEEVLREQYKLNGWDRDREITGDLAELQSAVIETYSPTAKDKDRIIWKANKPVIDSLAEKCVYVEQGKSSKTGSVRPLFELMKRDAILGRFDRLIVWKISRLGRDMREVLNTVYELADLGVTVYPVKSQTGPITSSMGKLLWALMSWQAEMENVERSEAINAGLKRARAAGKDLGRPRSVFDRDKAVSLHQTGLSNAVIARELGTSEATIRRVLVASGAYSPSVKNIPPKKPKNPLKESRLYVGAPPVHSK